MNKKTDELVKKLTLMGFVLDKRWNTVLKLHELIKSGKGTLEEYIPANKWLLCQTKENAINEITCWSTFDGFQQKWGDACIYLEISKKPKANKIRVKGSIFDGRMTDGVRTGKRFDFAADLPLEFVLHIENTIEAGWATFLDNAYDDYLDEQRRKWIKNYEKELLG